MSVGKRIATGRLRVDASRAVSKLRDYQLSDPRTWPREIVRAANAMKATAVRAFGDADDVWITWQGESADIAELKAVLNELVSPAAASERRGLRLLAIGVNTALGLGPRWVDLYALGPDGAQRVRYTAEILEPKDLGEDGLGSQAVKQVKPHPKLFASGGAVHFRRYPGFEAFRLFVRGAEPSELTDLRWACRDLPLPHEIGDTRVTEAPDLVRAELGMGLTGFVALVAGSPPHQGVLLDFAELGVHLAQRVTQEGGLHGPPIRLHLDAPRLPTNASRSEVRIEDSPVRDAVDRLGRVTPVLVEKIVEAWKADPSDALRFAIIRLVAAYTSGARWAHELAAVPEVFRPLLELKALRNGIGVPCSFRHFSDTIELVHRAPIAEPAALEPWLGNVLWAPPGSPEEQLLGDWMPTDATEYIAQARQNLAAWQKWYAQSPIEARIPHEPDQWVTIDVGGDARYPATRARRADLEWDGARGQVAVYGTRTGREGYVRLLLEGRPIAIAMVPSAIPFRAVLDVPGLQPQPDYKGVVHDETYERAIAMARAGAIAAAELIAGKLIEPTRQLPASVDMRETSDFTDLALIRRAQVALVAHLCGPAPESQSDIERTFRRGPLSKVPCWPIAHHDRTVKMLSIRELFDEARKHAELVCVRPDEVGAPYGRVAFVIEPDARSQLRVLLGGPTIILYSPPTTKVTAQELAPRERRSIVLHLSETSRRGVVVYSALGMPMVRRYHGGRFIDQRAHEFELVPVSIHCDDDGLVPSAMVTLDPADAFHPRGWEADWLRAVVDVLSGDARPELRAPGDVLGFPGLRRDLILALGRHAARRALGKERIEALMELPLVPRVGAQPVSLRFLQGQAQLEYLVPNEAGAIDLAEWSPMEIDEQLASAIAEFLGRNMHHATARLDALRERVARLSALRAHRARAKRTIPEAADDQVALSGKCRGVVGLGLTEQTRIDVWLEERPFAQILLDDNYPIVAIVDIPVKYARRDLVGLSREGEKLVVSTVRRAVPRLLVQLAETAPERLVEEAAPAAMLLRWLRETQRSKARTKLFEAPIFKSVHGHRISVKDACTKQRIRVGHFDGKWVGPAEGEPEHVLDGLILELPDGPQREALKTAYEALGHPRKMLDHTRALRELQTERRVAQNLVMAPTIPEVPEALRASLIDLRAASKRRLIGVGEIGLIEGNTSKLRVYANGELVGEADFDLRPTVCLATESLTLAESMRAGKKIAAGDHAKLLLHALLTQKIIGELPKHPRWVARAVRYAFGTGILERDELRGAAVFETTADRWEDYQALLDQQERFGDVWYTADDRPAERNRQPLDRKRLAFRLSEVEAEGLRAHLVLVDASEELRLDDRSRRNRARPEVAVFELPASLRDVLLGTYEWQHDQTEIVLGVLPASHAAYAGIHVHRDRRQVCVRREGGWPTIAFVEDPSLTINRTWDDVVVDGAYRALMSRIQKRVRLTFEELLEAPTDALVAYRPDEGFYRNHLHEVDAAHGIFWLDADIREGVVAVHGKSSWTTAPVQKGITLPLFGTLHLAHMGTPQRERTDLMLRSIYGELVGRVVHKLGSLEGTDLDRATAHLVLALGTGCWEPSKRAREVPLTCFHPEPETLDDLASMLKKRTPIDAFDAEDLRPDRPGLIRDGSATARAVEQVLGRQVRSKRIELALPTRVTEVDAFEPIEVPLQALGARLLSRLADLGHGHQVRGIVVLPEEKSVLLQWRADTHRLAMAGRHPMLEKLEAARISRAAGFDAALDLLAVHAIAVVSRHVDEVTAASVRTAAMRLLRVE